MNLISVIVPVYNVEEYLDRCIESIVTQTYKDLEIILVDDGSPDNCPEMCDEWAKKDERIKVIHKENGGLSDARNAGMKIATGEYIGFVDSDDFIHNEMYEILSSLLFNNSADVVQCEMLKFSEMPFSGFTNSEEKPVVSFTAEEAIRDLLTGKTIGVTCPNLIVKSNIAKSVLFEVGRINEDVLWTYRVFSKAEKITVTNLKLYAYYQRQGSIMNNDYSEKRFDALYSLEQRAEEIKTDFPDLYAFALKNYLGGCFYHYQTLCRMPKSDQYENFKKHIYSRFIKYDIKTVLSITSLKYKVWYILFKNFPDFTCKIRNVLKIGL